MTTDTKKRSSGEIALTDGHVFKWMIQNPDKPEVYGWVEKDWIIVKGSGGWFRTPDPENAARIAQSNLDYVRRA